MLDFQRKGGRAHFILYRSMDDVDGPVVAQVVYEALFVGEGNHVHFNTAPAALNRAVKMLRDRGVNPMRWAPYVHIGV